MIFCERNKCYAWNQTTEPVVINTTTIAVQRSKPYGAIEKGTSDQYNPNADCKCNNATKRATIEITRQRLFTLMSKVNDGYAVRILC